MKGCNTTYLHIDTRPYTRTHTLSSQSANCLFWEYFYCTSNSHIPIPFRCFELKAYEQRSDDMADPSTASASDAPPSAGGALVVWSNAGPRMLFRKEDITMPDHIRQHKDYHFFEKQWSTVCGFWVHRVQKEEKLQELSLAELAQHVVDDIQHRLNKKKQETAIHKKKKRLLQGKGVQHFGNPSQHVLLTNVCSLDDYLSQSEADREELVTAIITEVAKAAGKLATPPLPMEILIDEAEPNPLPELAHEGGAGSGDERAAKCARLESSNAKEEAKGGERDKEKIGAVGAPPPSYDERLALVVTLPTAEAAAAVIAHLSGRTLDGRRVVCHFFERNV